MVDRTKSEFQSGFETIAGDVEIGAAESDAITAFGRVLKSIQLDYPGIRCNIFSGNITDVCDKLDKGLLDYAIIMGFVGQNKYDYLSIPLHDNWGVMMKKGDALAEKDILSVQDLSDLPLICSRQWLSLDLSQWLGGAIRKYQIVATYNLAFNATMLVKAGVGYAVMLDKIANTSEESGLVFRPLKGTPETSMFVIWRKNQTFSQAASVLLERMKTDLQTLS